MSKSVKETVVEVACKYALSKMIVDKLGLSDEGKIDKFFDKVIKADERAVKQLEANKKAEKLQYDIEIEDLKEQIEDAEENVAASYLEVTPNDVENNNKANSFIENYWLKITKAETKLERLVKKMEDKKEVFKESTKAINEQIAKYNARIEKINGLA